MTITLKEFKRRLNSSPGGCHVEVVLGTDWGYLLVGHDLLEALWRDTVTDRWCLVSDVAVTFVPGATIDTRRSLTAPTLAALAALVQVESLEGA